MPENVQGQQRLYTAACPGCGAPVEFRFAQSAYAVCKYCHTTVLREGQALKAVGKSAELFDDFSPLSLGVRGRVGQSAFTLVGRLQYGYHGGRWTEWIAAFDDAITSAVLSEDNGSYVLVQPVTLEGTIAPAPAWSVGVGVNIGSEHYTVSSNQEVALIAAQGELPQLPPLNQTFVMVELRSDRGQILSIDFGSTPASTYKGAAVQLSDLHLTGLSDHSEKTEQGRSFDCPHCGASVSVKLAGTKSITCDSCSSVIDISQGIDRPLASVLQQSGPTPLIALGSVAKIGDQNWQAVGFQRRFTVPNQDNESFEWDEYLLYNLSKGFCFLVNDSEGWSLVAPTVGSPSYHIGSPVVKYQDQTFRLESSYEARTQYVLGEFYWKVQSGETTLNYDFSNARQLLSLEVYPNEQVWSSGGRIESSWVRQMFHLDQDSPLVGGAYSQMDDTKPVSNNFTPRMLIIGLIIILIIPIIILYQCSPNLGSSTGGYGYGGSYGGYSSSGGHK